VTKYEVRAGLKIYKMISTSHLVRRIQTQLMLLYISLFYDSASSDEVMQLRL